MAELGCLSSVCTEPAAGHFSHPTNVFLVTVTAFYTVYQPTLFFFVRFVSGAEEQGPYYGIDRFVVQWYAVRPKHSL